MDVVKFAPVAVSSVLALALAAAPSTFGQAPVEWHASSGRLPNDSVPPWGAAELFPCGPNALTLGSTTLTIDTSACVQSGFQFTFFRHGPEPPASTLYWVEADLRVVSSLGADSVQGAASLSMFPGPHCPFTLHFDIDRLVVTYARSREIARVSIDTTSEVRTWRLEVDPGQLSSRIFVDGIHVLSLLPPSAADCDLAPGEWGGVSFGEFGTLNGGLAEWRAIRHGFGAFETSFCEVQPPNSTGLPARLASSGSRDVAVNDFVLTGSQLPPGSLAYFLHSPTYSAPSPAGSTRGSLCLGAEVGRFDRPGEVQRTSTGGTASLALDSTSLPLPLGSVGLFPGDTWHFQLWYKDTAAAGTGALSSALQVAFH